MKQISESTYYEDVDKWDEIARNLGGIELYDDITGEPTYRVYVPC